MNEIKILKNEKLNDVRTRRQFMKNQSSRSRRNVRTRTTKNKQQKNHHQKINNSAERRQHSLKEMHEKHVSSVLGMSILKYFLNTS